MEHYFCQSCGMPMTSELFGTEKDASFKSSLGQIYQTFDGKELYPTAEIKAAMLLYLVVKNHSFVDGNKRIGMYVMLTFLEVNGVKVNFTNEEIVDIGMKIASSKMSYEELLKEIKTHINN